MSDKLKPCPFCGEGPTMYWGGPDTHVTIECQNGFCRQKITQRRLAKNSRITFEQLKAGTIERWNTRPVEDELVLVLRKSKMFIEAFMESFRGSVVAPKLKQEIEDALKKAGVV